MYKTGSSVMYQLRVRTAGASLIQYSTSTPGFQLKTRYYVFIVGIGCGAGIKTTWCFTKQSRMLDKDISFCTTSWKGQMIRNCNQQKCCSSSLELDISSNGFSFNSSSELELVYIEQKLKLLQN